jgi:hypothetical protein
MTCRFSDYGYGKLAADALGNSPESAVKVGVAYQIKKGKL